MAYHIVIVARELRTSTGRYVERLLAHLQEIDTVNRYTVLLKPEDVEGWKPIGKNFKAIACPYKDYSLGEQIGLYRQLKSLKPDLVHFSMAQQPIFYPGKVVTTIQDLTIIRFNNPSKNKVIYWIKQQVYKLLNIIVAHKSAHIITPTEFVREDVSRYCHVSINKITATLEAADSLAAHAKPVEKLKGKDFIMYVGRPTPHKNLARLIDAFVILQKKHPSLYLVLAGKLDYNYQLHKKRVQRDGIKNVVFTDFVSDAELVWLYENTRVYCFPSLSEGFGLPGLESMVHGAVVACSNATCLPEVYGEAAHYFDPYKPESIASSIDELLVSDTLRKKYQALGPRQVAKYSWRRMAKQTHKIYVDALRE